MDIAAFYNNVYQAFQATTTIEWIGFATALTYSILAAYEKPLCWLFALISSFLYLYICVEASLYLQSTLQVFYLVMAGYGWWSWRKQNENVNENEKEGESESERKGGEESGVVDWSGRELILYTMSGFVVALITGFLFANYTETHLPWLDATITVFSFLATWMMTRKILQNWLFWIIIDAATVLLYAKQGLALSALLYIIYTLIASFGYLQWRKNSLFASR